ncbi:MAG: DUF1015 family protein [Proteobacteria bacterium]|nr:DUF1015 family protein [Pseudomonadota bacterium]
MNASPPKSWPNSSPNSSAGFLVRPFAALRPAFQHAQAVAAPPYDVVNSDEAREMAAGKEWSFFHVSKAEIDLPPGTDPYGDAVYAKARENLDRMIDGGILVRDTQEAYYIYRVQMGDHQQTGVVAAASVAAYKENRILRHELTRPAKETDRVRQIEAVNAHTGPVFVTHRPNARIMAIIERATASAPDCAVTDVGNADHTIWVIDDAAEVAQMTAAFTEAGTLYIADGHHRSAAAERVADARRSANDQPTGDENYETFLVVSFPDDEVQIFDYNRVIRDLNGQEKESFLEAVGKAFDVQRSEIPVRPSAPRQFGMYMDGEWYHLKLSAALADDLPPVDCLDVSLMTRHLIEPILGITDPRVDPRIDFVGGARGLEGLEIRVDGGDWAVAFSYYPTSMADLMAVADAGEIMPPKTTWFEPKLADGLVSLVLD